MKCYHVYGKAPYYTNCYVLTDNTGNAVMIDCSADVEKVKKILTNDRCELKAILLTHGHADHRETLDDFRAEFDCPVYLDTNDAIFYGVNDTTGYTDGGKLQFGEIKLFTLFTPGHTPGGYCIIGDEMLFCGDTLFAGTIGRTDMPGGDQGLLMNSLKKLLDTLKGDLKVLPGHNEFSTFEHEKAHNYFLLKAKDML